MSFWPNKGQVDLRSGDVQFLDPTRANVLRTVQFSNLSPTSFQPFASANSRRVIEFAVERNARP